MINHSKFIIFDFDGVVCDSTNECMVTAWNAWEKFNTRKNFRRSIDEFTEHEKLSFRNVRPRVRGAGEYYILQRAFSEKISIETQNSYNSLEQEWQSQLIPFKSIFFEMREKLRHENLEQWINLHDIYKPVVNVMLKLHSYNRLYIATLKDAESVNIILAKQGLNLSKSKILDQSQIKSKLQALIQFQSQLHCDKSNMIFIDDNVTHLIEPKSAGYSVFLTTWGTQLDEYLLTAKQHNIPLIDNCAYLLNNI